MNKMEFSGSVIAQAWKRAGGRCECSQNGHRHGGRCNRPLSRYAEGMHRNTGWEVNHITATTSGAIDPVNNCEILCLSCCEEAGRFPDKKSH